LAGSALLAYTGWRAIFYALLIAAALSLIVLTFAQPETLPRDQRQRFDLGETLRGAQRLMTDRAFLSLTFMGAFGMASFFVFLASAAFVYTEHFGLTPTQFSLAFAANAVSFIGASQLAGPLGARLGAIRLMRRATMGFAGCACALFALALMGQANLWVCIIGLGLGNACLGLVIPTAMVMALDDHGDIAGLASSLGGTLQMMTGGVIVALMGPFFTSSPVPMIGVIALCALTAFALSRLTVKPQAASA
jgi:DHA1 family bicyclomycin/chloramphenicol resistance-like MFS transporter